jgi:membrane-associated phospholipid phosphatase
VIAPRLLVTRAPRLLVAELLGLPLAALLALAGALWAFAALAEDYVTGDPIIRFDHRLANGLHDRAAEPFTTAMRIVTDLGGAILLAAVCLAAYTVLSRRGERPLGVFVVAAFLGAQLLTAVLKVGFHRDRPVFDEPLASAGAYSFPSGHALVSLVAYGALAFVLATHLRTPHARVACFAGAGLLAVAIGFSRLYLGLHFLSDVLAGYSAGTAWLLVCIATVRIWTQRRVRVTGGERAF